MHPTIQWDELLEQTRARFPRVGVVYGGVSSEREVSIRSGKKVAAALEAQGFTVLHIDPADSLTLPQVDVIYNVLHGRWGEDGCLQGYLELLQIPYTGPGVEGCVVSMNKWLARQVLEGVGIPIPKGGIIQYVEDVPKKFPVIVKPACEGSSIGVCLIETISDWQRLMPDLLKNFSNLFWETYIPGREITVGVIGPESGPWALPILELRPKNKFYDYQAKYTHGMTEFFVPAEFADEQTQEIQQLAVDVFRTLGCRGVGRIDMMVHPDKGPFVLELNASPGMTDLSDLPAEAGAMGWSYEQLVLYIISLASLDALAA